MPPPLIIPMFVSNESPRCPHCDKKEEKIKVCAHCNYKYSTEEPASTLELIGAWIIVAATVAGAVFAPFGGTPPDGVDRVFSAFFCGVGILIIGVLVAMLLLLGEATIKRIFKNKP